VNKRHRPPPNQVPHMPFAHYVTCRARAAGDVRRAVDIMWCSLARPSDWLGSRPSRRPPVPLADVTCLPGFRAEILYRKTKPDPEGVGRRVRIALPPRTWEWLRVRKATQPPQSPVITLSFDRLKRAFAPYPLRSVRRGTIRLALLQGISARTVCAISGHRDPRTVLRYAGLMCPKEARRSAKVSSAVLRPRAVYRR